MKTSVHFLSYLAQSFLKWKMFQIKVVEKIGTHILFSTTFVENRAVNEIMWKNVERGRPQMTLWRMRIASWIPKATNTHSGCVILLLFRCNNGYRNDPECYVTRTEPVLFMIFFSPPRRCRFGYKIIPPPFSFKSWRIIQWSYVESSLELCNSPHWGLRPVNDWLQWH